MSKPTENPYVGLRAFEEKDAGSFIDREEAIRRFFNHSHAGLVIRKLDLKGNPFDPKYSLGLLSLIGNNTPPKTENALASAASPSPGISALARALTGSPPPPSGGAVSDLFGSGLSGVFGAAYDLGLLSQPQRTNPFGSLSDLIDSSPPPPAPLGFGGALSPFLSNSNPPPPSPLGSGALSGLPISNPPSSPLGFGALSGHFPTTNPPPPALYRLPVQPKPKPVAPTVKRKAFFSFHFDDIMRVNNVRNGWKITHPDSALSGRGQWP